jgi:hypothetical protein
MGLVFSIAEVNAKYACSNNDTQIEVPLKDENGVRKNTWSGLLSNITMEAADALNQEQPAFMKLKEVAATPKAKATTDK